MCLFCYFQILPLFSRLNPEKDIFNNGILVDFFHRFSMLYTVSFNKFFHKSFFSSRMLKYHVKSNFLLKMCLFCYFQILPLFSRLNPEKDIFNNGILVDFFYRFSMLYTVSLNKFFHSFILAYTFLNQDH